MDENTDSILIVRVDSLMARTLELEGRLGFHCPLLERPGSARTGSIRENGSSYRDLAPVLNHSRGGVMAVVSEGRTLGYAVFGPPAVFRGAADLSFQFDEDGLLIGALYATPDAREQNLDVDLLVAVLGFAREQGYRKVQAVCRANPDEGPEARIEVIRAAGFQTAGSDGELSLGTLAIDNKEAGR